MDIIVARMRWVVGIRRVIYQQPPAQFIASHDLVNLQVRVFIFTVEFLHIKKYLEWSFDLSD